jgi:hypothetical protein
MVVRIKFGKGPVIRKDPKKNRRAAMALAALLDPAAVMAVALALWSIAAERKWVGNFAIDSGVFSHWETWLAVAAALELCALALNRYGKSGGAAAV